jgi:hypothetical protein
VVRLGNGLFHELLGLPLLRRCEHFRNGIDSIGPAQPSQPKEKVLDFPWAGEQNGGNFVNEEEWSYFLKKEKS